MTTVQAAATRRVSRQLDTLCDFDCEPTHHALMSLYVTEVLIPRLERLGRFDAHIPPRYRKIGLPD
jgi:hypothetical protein